MACSLSFGLSITGTFLLVAAIVIHIVCIATPYMGGMNLEHVVDIILRKVVEKFTGQGYSREIVEELAAEVAYKRVDYGPWQYCSTNMADKVTCGSWPENSPGWIDGTRAFAIIAILLAGLALIMSFVNLFCLTNGNWRRPFSVIACVASFAAGGMIVIELVIVGIHFRGDTSQYAGVAGEDKLAEAGYLNWGYGVEVVAVLVLMVAGLIHLVGRREAKIDDE